MSAHAAFLIAPAGRSGRLAATTRPGGQGIGLPGGKLLPGESAAAAAVREAAEEGWQFAGPARLILVHRAEVDGRPVEWYATRQPVYRLAAGRHAEAGRVEPVTATVEQVRASGHGNRAALAAWRAAGFDCRPSLGRTVARILREVRP